MIIIADKSGRRSKHGMSRHPLYSVWTKIKDRVYNPNHESYHIYGGDGVTMCEEWKNDATRFIEWALANGWQPGLNIDKDKIPFELGIPAKIYSPEMCSILTTKENNRYTKYNDWIEFNGKKLTLNDWSVELGIDQATLHHRLYDYGYSIEEAFTLPRTGARNKRYIEYNGTRKRINEWSKIIGINRNTIIHRLEVIKMSVEEAFTTPTNSWATRKRKK